MLTVMSEGLKTSYKEVTTQVFTVLLPLYEIITVIIKKKIPLESSTYASQPSVTMTSNSPVISSSLFHSFFFRSML